MRRRPILVYVILSGSLAAFGAQQGVREVPPLYRGPVTQVQGVVMTPIPGAPFSAVVIIESKQLLPDGSVTTRHTQTNIARDSTGRIRNEIHAMVADGFQGAPPLVGVHIFDPQTRIRYYLDPVAMIARQQLVPPAPRHRRSAPPGAENLGYQILSGMQTKGTRVTHTVPAQLSTTGKEVKVTDEFWYSEDLHMNLLERHADVRGGVQTVAILSIKTEEPPPSLFGVPQGYKIADLTPPENSPASRMNARP